ncbi:MAG: class I SAM-dependent methyltransferase [Silicimonas sp.]|nr:class I SAM-dependent methyltransferase [Silicimonas sp.]
MTPNQAFFTVHADLPREGPGLPEDVHWALDLAQTPEDAVILDAGCGPGADFVTLAEARPRARVHGIDFMPDFAAEAGRRGLAFGNRARAWAGDYTDLDESYDLIWCAGAAYFKGFLTVLDVWRDHLKPGGAVAFSEPACKRDLSPAAAAFWEGEYEPRTRPELDAELTRAGWAIEGQRWIEGAAWEAYYGPMAARLERLKAGDPAPALRAAIEEAEAEIAQWRAAPGEVVYSLFLVRPA